MYLCRNKLNLKVMNNTLKTLMGGVILLLAAVLVSCSKSADNNIIGKWQSTTVAYQTYEGDRLVDEGSSNCIDWYLGFEFREGGSGQIIDYDSGAGSSTLPITWVIMGDKLIITSASSASSLTFDIVSISSSSMVLSLTSEYAESGVRYRDVETYTFKKI